jgi:SAM-dependent methyltransferase
VNDPQGPAQPRTRADWEARYQTGNTPWDLGGAPPVLGRALAALGPGRGRRALVPGAGPGHDALAFARAGWATTAVDIAPSACAALRKRAARAGLPVDVLEADVLDLPASLRSRFDVAWEQTCLCALPPESREAYVRVLRDALRPDGLLLALLWNHGQPGGPPYDLPPGLARTLLAPCFDEVGVETLPPQTSGRQGEYLLRLRPRR